MFLKMALLLFVSTTLVAGEAMPVADVSADNARWINQKRQKCMLLVDQDVVQTFIEKGEKLNKSVKALCENNERNDAQNEAVGFALEIQKSKDLSVLKQCSRIGEQETSKIMLIAKKYFISALRYTHICDYDRP